MTKDEMVHLLKTDVEAWNDWRSTYPFHPVDLSGANFRDCRLDHAVFKGAKLVGTMFMGASLRGSDLRMSDLNVVDFSSADLSHAQLSGADLRDGYLDGTILRYAHLGLTTIGVCSMNQTDLTGATVGRTAFNQLDLSRVAGLATLDHFGASSIGLDTICLSQGKIPAEFLRGVGTNEVLIDYLSTYLRSHEDAQFHSCFISFSFNDVEFARLLYKRMQDEKLRVWFAPEDGRGGLKLHEQLATQIHRHDKLLLLLSEHSMRSQWVETEVYHARQREVKEGSRVLFPIMLCPYEHLREWKCFDADSGKDMAREIREFLVPDFSGWKDQAQFEAGFKKLLRDLKIETVPPANQKTS